ncbi:hypothetical protein HPULCUR_012015 [Helicostylum pulchrum]|uniref:Uncharacterized protein n=1 Tax=Helicostylum pulchrum TaxID=562976 RepID=A0ABP9YHS4_9FUNG
MTRINQAIGCIKQYSTSVVKQATSTKKLVYNSPNAGLVKLVKKFSLTTLGISAIATPSVMFFWQSPAESLTRYAITQMFMTAMMASACSTGALSFLLSPYVNAIYVHTPQRLIQSDKAAPISPNTVISIDTLNLLARRKTTTLHIKDLLPTNSSVLTWTVNKQVIKRQYALEQEKGIKPTIQQDRFWLDQRNGTGDRDIMSSILRIVHEQGRQRFL